MVVQIQLRRDTAANWTSADPTLADGEVGLETDTGKLKWGDGSTAWSGLAYFSAGSLTNPMTTKGDIILGDTGGTPTRLGAGTSTYVLTSNGAGAFPSWQVGGGGGGGALAAHPMPLDSYAIDGTYGDDFTGASLAGIWTRRNVPSSETFQYGPMATYMRSVYSGLAKGDGYYQTAPAGDWTFAVCFTARPSQLGFGVAVVDSSGTGVHAGFYNSPIALIVSQVTTYTSYGGSFQQSITLPSLPGNTETPRKMWLYLRKASGNYYGNYSLDGEVWGDETPALAWAGTVDRIAMSYSALVTPGASQLVDVDIFNKIA